MSCEIRIVKSEKTEEAFVELYNNNILPDDEFDTRDVLGRWPLTLGTLQKYLQGAYCDSEGDGSSPTDGWETQRRSEDADQFEPIPDMRVLGINGDIHAGFDRVFRRLIVEHGKMPGRRYD